MSDPARQTAEADPRNPTEQEEPQPAAAATKAPALESEARPAGADGEPEAVLPPARIRVTDAAHEALGRMIDDAELAAEGGVRLSAHTGAGCSAPLRYDMALEPAPEPDDAILERDGVRIFMDPESAWVLDGLLVDYVTSSPMGEGFAFRHPNGRSGRAC